jgi:uncharacterized membrane protein YphA (DoxX/SURF4 family)
MHYTARTLRSKIKNGITFNMFLHIEHHLFPRVPTCHLGELSRRRSRGTGTEEQNRLSCQSHGRAGSVKNGGFTMQVCVPLSVLGRILSVSYFVSMGTNHVLKFQEHSAHLARKGVLLPRAVTVLTFVMMVGGGILVLFNWHPELGAASLFCIIFPAPFYLHRFWNETDRHLRLSEFAHIIKDVSLAGAAILLFSIR